MTDQDGKTSRKPAWGARAVGSYMARILDPVARERGFTTTALLSAWPAIVGAELASFTLPDKIVWPRRQEDSDAKRHRPEGATLTLRVDGPRAIELQHCADQILERVNVYFGYRAVTEMRILQAPVAKTKRGNPPAPTPLVEASLPPQTEIGDEGLRRALMRLGGSASRTKG
jgi:hypothetical protein